jgi:hypothetical protein
MSRNAPTNTDTLSRMLAAVKDDDARRWLEAMLVHGEAAEVQVGNQPRQTTTRSARRAGGRRVIGVGREISGVCSSPKLAATATSPP